MSKPVTLGLLSLLVVIFGLAISPVFATVENLNVSPSVLVVGKPITFSGTVVEATSSYNPYNYVLEIYIYPGFGCSYSPSGSIAFAAADANANSGTFSSTLSFPASLAPSGPPYSYSPGWIVSSRSYQNGLPAGSYSVYVIDVGTSVLNPSGGLCRYFTITNS